MEEDLFMNAPAELQYLLQCCEAVTEERYEEAILLFHQGLLENQKEPDQIKTSDLLPLLHALFREIELSLGPNIAIKWRKLWEQTHKAEKLVEPTCSFCIKKQSEVFKLIAGHGGYICDECVRTCLNVLIDIIANESNKEHGKNHSDKGA